jgi:hypothetical protein
MLEKTWERECVGGYGMLCVMRVLDEYEPKEVPDLVTSPKCIKQVLDEFLNVMPEELPEDLPSRRQATMISIYWIFVVIYQLDIGFRCQQLGFHILPHDYKKKRK